MRSSLPFISGWITLQCVHGGQKVKAIYEIANAISMKGSN